MAITNNERVGKALDLLKAGLGPYVDRELQSAIEGGRVTAEILAPFVNDANIGNKPPSEWDVAALLKFMWDSWNSVFKQTLGFSDRSLVSELRGNRNEWAHQNTFSSDDVYRVLDSTGRLLTSVSAAEQIEEIEKMKNELLRLRYSEQVRNEKKKAGGSLIELAVAGNLRPWKDIITPHHDVASGNYQQAEFAADLWQVHLGQGSSEYRDPAEFFKRTFLTESLKRLLSDAMKRLTGSGGDPVVQLQTNFGGGKTHSMLALYHLFSGVSVNELAGADELVANAGVTEVPRAVRVVLVGNKISPGNPLTKDDGTVVKTLWGELAWQLGGKPAFDKIAADDANATNPGDRLRELMDEYGPCLILIDEWVAYARQLHDSSDLPGGSFETQFTFAQALTESAKLAKNCLLVISLPASEGLSPHAQADDIEVGGIRGREALSRLQNVIGRVESSWRAATAEEGFEIVRRRLFQPMDAEQHKQRDVTAAAFAELYHKNHQEFPTECRESDYEKRIQAAYPIHPEIFDRLYTDWSTLVKFQRTRGVLRLMAAVIHSLWEAGDKNPIIMPSTIPIDDDRVRWELTRYLSEEWSPIIDKDVDGPNSLPHHIDTHNTNLGRIHAARRVARTVYLGSAPVVAAAQRGIEDRRIKLGCVMPGESPNLFGDALRRLAGAATYLYQDGSRYWYSTQPTVAKLAADRKEQLTREPDKVADEIKRRLKENLKDRGEFRRIHEMPASSAEVPDDRDARLVVLGPDHYHTKEKDGPAEKAAKGILETRGNSPRIYRNTLVFIAADKSRLQDLDDAVRGYLAWDSIVNDSEQLNLDTQQKKNAVTQMSNADSTVNSRIPETYRWALVPAQSTASDPIEWKAVQLTGQDPLAIRAVKKLKNEELLLTSFGGTRLRMDMDQIPLWRGDHVEIRQLVEDYAKYIYLPRLIESEVLLQAAMSGMSSLTPEFAYAELFDEATSRYRGLTYQASILDADTKALLVKPEVANAQQEQDRIMMGLEPTTATTGGTDRSPTDPTENSPDKKTDDPVNRQPNRFHGSVDLDPQRIGRDAGQIADEIISHLTTIVGSRVTVTLEVNAEIEAGVPENVIRTVTENSRTLKFTSHGFERD